MQGRALSLIEIQGNLIGWKQRLARAHLRSKRSICWLFFYYFTMTRQAWVCTTMLVHQNAAIALS